MGIVYTNLKIRISNFEAKWIPAQNLCETTSKTIILLLLQFLPVSQELLDPDIRERMLHELIDHAEGDRCDMRAGKGRVHDMERIPDARDDHFRREPVVLVDIHDLPHEVHADVADVVQPAHE